MDCNTIAALLIATGTVTLPAVALILYAFRRGWTWLYTDGEDEKGFPELPIAVALKPSRRR